MLPTLFRNPPLRNDRLPQRHATATRMMQRRSRGQAG